MLAALMTLATAMGASPTLAEELRRGEVAGESARVTRNSVLQSVYSVAMSRTGLVVGAMAFRDLGYNKRESVQMSEMAIGIVRKSGSFENFQAVLKGQSPKGVKLGPREMAMLRSFGARQEVAGGDGRTWEGHALINNKPHADDKPSVRAVTWEGSEVD